LNPHAPYTRELLAAIPGEGAGGARATESIQ